MRLLVLDYTSQLTFGKKKKILLPDAVVSDSVPASSDEELGA